MRSAAWFLLLVTGCGDFVAGYSPCSDKDKIRWFPDADGDTHGDNWAVGVLACSNDGPDNHVTSNDDCNDNDASVHPDAEEVCNGVDDDCVDGPDTDLDFLLYYPDADEDGFGNKWTIGLAACAPVDGMVADNTDCADSDPAINPAAAEVCNGLDDDCIDGPDSGLTFIEYYPDADGDGFGSAWVPGFSACEPQQDMVEDSTDCDDYRADVNPLATEMCNGVDDDCNGDTDGVDSVDVLIWYRDSDVDGHGDLGTATIGCTPPDLVGWVLLGDDCDDGDRDTHPGAIERCDGIDNDCDGSLPANEADTDGDGLPACGGDCDDGDPSTHPGAPEVCDGADNDCDGVIDDNAVDETVWHQDLDGDGHGTDVTQLACDPPPGYVDITGDCDDLDASVYPGSPEFCDGIDGDCDGVVDEGALCPCYESTYYGNHRYLFCFGPGFDVNWFDAQDRCESVGYHGVVIEDLGEQNALAAELSASSVGDEWWTGGILTVYSGWYWLPLNTQIGWYYWNSGEPNGGEACVELDDRGAGDYRWNDEDCFNTQGYICESFDP